MVGTLEKMTGGTRPPHVSQRRHNMKQRAKGSGSIFRRSRDGRWVAMITLPSVNGKRVRRQKLARTEEEAGMKLAELLEEYTPYTVFLPQPLGDAAVEKAEAHDETLSDVVRPAVEEYVENV
jgi:hypothetical protein